MSNGSEATSFLVGANFTVECDNGFELNADVGEFVFMKSFLSVPIDILTDRSI